MSGVRGHLKAAREALAAKQWHDVLTHCKAALQEDRSCYEAYVYIGKAAFRLGEHEKAELSYQRATELNEQAPQAWQGLSELYHDSQQWSKAAEADQALVNMGHRGDASLAPRLPALARRLGEALVAAGQLEEAEVALRDVLGCDMTQDERLPVLGLLADVQLKEDRLVTDAKVATQLAARLREAGGDANKVCEEAVTSAVMSELADEALELDCDHATPTLKEIICRAAPTPSYVRFHDTYLRKLRQAVNVAPPGSMDRHNRRVAVLEVCRVMMEGRSALSPAVGQGCASPYAYETALRLLEIEEEIVGGRMPRSTSQGDFGGGGLPRSGSMAWSGVASPEARSGVATPTASGGGAAGAMFSPRPGSFFGGGSLAHRVGSYTALGDALAGGLRSGHMTPLETVLSGGVPPPGQPATPKRDMSSARLMELVLHPLAAASAAAGNTMAEENREGFSQLAAECSTAGCVATGVTAANTPGSGHTPIGSLGGDTGPFGAPGTSVDAPKTTGLARVGSLAAGLSSLHLGPPAIISRNSSVDMTGASPRYAGTPSALTPKASLVMAAPILMADREVIATKLAHAFPWNATGQVHLAMALRRREAYMDSKAANIRLTCAYQGPHVTDLSCSALAQRLRAERPRQLARRAWLVATLAKGLAAGAPVVSAMIGLAELRLEAGDAQGALEAAKHGIKFVFDRNKIGKERARHAALMLNLLAAQALLAGGQVTDAGRIFVRLAARVSEGEVGFGSEAVGLPATSIRQQAIRGLAQCALAQGDACQALHHYGELVSKALMGRGSAEHWAYAEYGWLLFQEGNSEAGRYQLETALDVFHRQTGGLGSDAVVAGYHYKLGRIYWALGGEFKAEREYCHAQLLEAAAEEGGQQAEAFEWLGHWYVQVADDELRARKCYQRALALDPTLAGAGNALCDLLSARAAAAAAAASEDDGSTGAAAAAAAAADSQLALEQQLLEELLVRAPDAQWARGRLAGLQLQLRAYEAAVPSFQAAIRASPKAADLWEGLGAAYHALGRHASALKAFTRALELDPSRPYCLMAAGALQYEGGAYEGAAKHYRSALELMPTHAAALLGLAEVLLSAACQHVAMGATGAAAVELEEAAQRAAAAVAGVRTAPLAAAAATDGAAPRPTSACPAVAAAALLTPQLAARSPATAPSTPGGGAAADVAAAGQPPAPCEVLDCSSNLVTAWKLLGDILLQQHLLQPASVAAAAAGNGASTGGSDADAAVAAALQQLAVRRDLLARARRAYAHALLLNPSAGEVWGDVALCYSHSAKLLLELQPPAAQAQKGEQEGAVSAQVAAARAAAVRTARGGLRLAPASSWLWGVLAASAASAGDPAAAEYSYSRALALDPKAAMLWVQLGRLYSRYGSAELAEQCYEAARGAEPTLVPVWEGMAATAAAGGSLAGSAAAAAAADHAVGLGGGPESWLQYATAAARRPGGSRDGLFLACASKASAHQPLLLAPTAALAAALEGQQQHASAAAALRYCLALLQASVQQGPDGCAALGLSVGGTTAALAHQLLLLPPAAADGAAGGDDDVPQGAALATDLQAVSTALELSLARNLALVGSVDDALALYQRLEADGALRSSSGSSSTSAAGADSCSWLCYGHAALQAGDDTRGARALQTAIDCAPDGGIKLAAVTALLHHHLHQGGLEDGFALLLQHLPAISSSCPGLADACTRPWLSLMVAAAAAGAGPLQEQVAEVLRQCSEGQQQHVDMAWLEAEQQCIAAATSAAQGAKFVAVRQLARAVHTCPWHTPARLRLAQQAMAANLREAPAAYRACLVLLPEATAAAAGSTSSSMQQLSTPDVLAAAAGRATALSAEVAAAVAHVAGQEVARLQRLLHALPDSPDVWYCLALAALQRAIGDGQAGHFRTALRCCTSALVRVKALLKQGPSSSSSSSSSNSSASLAACDAAALQHVQVRLMVAISECHQHSRLPGCHDAAHQWAMDALAVAMAGGGGGVAAATAHRQVGRMLASEGMAVEAEMAYRQAAAAASGDVAAAAQLELAKLLLGQGRTDEAATLLHSIWHGASQALSAAAATSQPKQQQQLPHGCSNFVEAAALEEALLLSDLGQLDAARAAAAAGLALAGAAGEADPAAAELVTASVALRSAEAAPLDAQRNLLLEARWAASSAAKSGLALPGTVGTAAAGVSAAVLAAVEVRRNKPDKAYDAIGMSFGAWVDQAVPAAVLIAAGELSGELADCAAAVHTAPWLGAAWERLQLTTAALGRPMLLL